MCVIKGISHKGVTVFVTLHSTNTLLCFPNQMPALRDISIKPEVMPKLRFSTLMTREKTGTKNPQEFKFNSSKLCICIELLESKQSHYAMIVDVCQRTRHLFAVSFTDQISLQNHCSIFCHSSEYPSWWAVFCWLNRPLPVFQRWLHGIQVPRKHVFLMNIRGRWSGSLCLMSCQQFSDFFPGKWENVCQKWLTRFIINISDSLPCKSCHDWIH